MALFTTIGGQPRKYIAKLNSTNDSADATWCSKASNYVRSIAINGSDIYVGGIFGSIGGPSRNYIAKLNNADGIKTGNTQSNFALFNDRVLPVELVRENVQSEYKLEQNYPNPFNPSTTKQFAIPKTGIVDLKTYNILGEAVAEVINREMNAGFQSVKFDASNLSSGLYFYRINTGNFTDVKKMMLLK